MGELRIILLGLAVTLALGGCAPTQAQNPDETYLCTEIPNGLAECSLVQQAS